MILVIFASLLPGLFWLWYFERYDVGDKEPIGKLLQCIVFGAIAVIPALIWEAPFRNLLSSSNSLPLQFTLSFLVVGLGEELFKFLAVFLAVRRSPEFSEPMDGIIYSITAAIGFSVVENILYISAFGLVVAPLRGTIATLAHIAFSGFFGYYFGRYWFLGRSKSDLVKGLILASALHGLYDFLLITRLVPAFLLILGIFGLHYFLIKAIKDAVNARVK